MPPLLDIPPSGSFNAWSQGFEFPDLLLAICKREQSGELKFMSSEAEKTILVHDGEIVFAKSSSTDDRLGPYLLRENLIRFEHVTELSRFVSPEKRFGTVLVENGVLDPHELVQGVVGQVRSIVLSLFQWTEAAYIFEQREPDKEDITLRIPLTKLIVDGVRQVTSWRRVMGGIGSLDAIYQTIAGVEDTVRAAKLTPEQLDLVAEMRGPKTIAEACAATEISDFEVCQLALGVLRAWLGRSRHRDRFESDVRAGDRRRGSPCRARGADSRRPRHSPRRSRCPSSKRPPRSKVKTKKRPRTTRKRTSKASGWS